MKILHILRAPTGGLWRHVADLSMALAQRGHQVGLVMDARFTDAQTRARLAALKDHLALGVHRLTIARMPVPGDLVVALKLRKLARRLEIDIAHGHGAKGGVYARLIRWNNRRTAAFYTPHGGVLNYAQHSLQGRLFRQAERRLGALTSAIIFESEFARHAFAEQVGPAPCPVAMVHNGLDEAEFIPVAAEDDADDFVFIGELRPVKGVELLINALVPLKRSDGAPATLSIIGDGPFQKHIMAQIARLKLVDRVRLHGAQPPRYAFEKGRCVVVPSLAESLPYVILEAAAAQKPLVCTRVGGVAEIFGPTEASLVPAGDTAALQIAMQHFLDAPSQAMADMRQRLVHVRDGFSIPRMTDRIEQAYADALAR